MNLCDCKTLTAILFRDFIIRTIAASISCLRSSSTLLRVSLCSGSDSPLAATVWILTLKTNWYKKRGIKFPTFTSRYALNVANVRIKTCDISRRIRRWRKIHCLLQCPWFLLFVPKAVGQPCPSIAIAMPESNPFLGCQFLVESLRMSTVDVCWTTSKHTSKKSIQRQALVSNRMLCSIKWQECTW